MTTHIGDIPDYAMQPAKAAKFTDADAIYDIENLLCRARPQIISYELEEELLVPDIKPDMEEILSVTGQCDITPEKKNISPENEDSVNLTGNISMQVLYVSSEGEMVSLNSKIPYKYRWKTAGGIEGECRFSCRIKSISNTISNERKFRVKILMEFSIEQCSEYKLDLLTGLRDDNLEIKKEPVCIRCVAGTLHDEMEIEEKFSSDEDIRPAEILRQEYSVRENYKQVTNEKIIINGFLYASLIYRADCERDGEKQNIICQHNEKIEFTQFIPIGKNLRNRDFDIVHVEFSSDKIKTSIVDGENAGENEDNAEFSGFLCRGAIDTEITLLEKCQKEIAVDAYHTEKVFNYEENELMPESMCTTACEEVSARGMINLKEKKRQSLRKQSDNMFVICEAETGDMSWRHEKGILTGTVHCKIFYENEDGIIKCAKGDLPFEREVECEAMADGGESKFTVCRCRVDSACGEYINDSQIEVKCALTAEVEVYEKTKFTLLTKPTFAEGINKKKYSMVIATVLPGEDLWTIAKRFGTTESAIASVNNIEGNLLPYSHLLIVK